MKPGLNTDLPVSIIQTLSGGKNFAGGQSPSMQAFNTVFQPGNLAQMTSFELHQTKNNNIVKQRMFS